MPLRGAAPAPTARGSSLGRTVPTGLQASFGLVHFAYNLSRCPICEGVALCIYRFVSQMRVATPRQRYLGTFSNSGS